MMIDVNRVRAELPLAPESSGWFDAWDAVTVDGPVPVPSADEARALLLRLGADTIDADACAAARPDPRDDAALWWVLERCHAQAVATMGEPDMLLWPALPTSTGDKGRFLYLYALLSTIPSTLEFYRSRGIAEDVMWATLSNIGEKLRLNRKRYGIPGLAVAFWFTLHARGSLFRLGRLEYAVERVRDGEATGLPPGSLRLGVHIPGEGGPLSREACVASLARVDGFVARHLPDVFAEPPTLTCSSWLLDPRLRDGLGPTSHIVAFQDLFTLTPPGPDAETNGLKDVLLFVFNRVDSPDPAELPRTSRLERLLADGIADGTRWAVRTGIVTRPFPQT